MVTDLLMVFDVESVGLYGEGFAVGWVIVNRAGGIVSRGAHACHPDKAVGFGSDPSWVDANIPVPGSGYDCYSAEHLREVFWGEWMEWKSKGATLVADCPYPVEAGFLRACVADDLEKRKWDGPYPLVDVASVLIAAGIDPMQKFPRLPAELPEHDPLRDAIQSARLLISAMAKMKEIP